MEAEPEDRQRSAIDLAVDARFLSRLIPLFRTEEQLRFGQLPIAAWLNDPMRALVQFEQLDLFDVNGNSVGHSANGSEFPTDVGH